MIYVYGYLAIGVAVLSVIYFSYRFAGRIAPSKINAALRADKRIDWLEKVVAPVLAAVLIVVAWPVALLMKVSEYLSDRAEAAEKNEPVFTVARADLREKNSFEEIERRELVEDPLNCVPNLPFGHLHDAWLQFKQKASPQDEIWSFAAIWNAPWHGQERRSGYVIMKPDGIGAHLLLQVSRVASPATQQ
jgi:hypothetical protein